jgi:hypothetical protein
VIGRLTPAAAFALLALSGTLAPATAASVAPVNLRYSTYFGGPGSDVGFMVAAAPAGGVYTTGFLQNPGDKVAYAVSYDTTAHQRWETLIAGTGNTSGYYVRANASAVYVVGVTSARDLPRATNTYTGGSATAFVAVLDPGSGSLMTTTYLGGPGYSAANVAALDPVTGDLFVGISAASQTEILLLDPSATSVLRSTTLGGGGGSTHPYGMQADAAGNVIVATLTYSAHYPVLNAQQSSYGGGGDTGVTKLAVIASGLVIQWSTYLGGRGEDRPNGLDVDASGNVYVAGRTYSSNFPTAKALQPTSQDNNDGYVTSYTSGGVMRYSTYLGGNGADWLGGVAVSGDGTAWVVGGTSSSDLSTPGGAAYLAKKTSYAYVAALRPDGSALSYATYLGGSRVDGAAGAVVVSGGVWVIGRTSSANFPTAQPAQPTNAGSFDAWVGLLAST